MKLNWNFLGGKQKTFGGGGGGRGVFIFFGTAQKDCAIEVFQGQMVLLSFKFKFYLFTTEP